MNPTNYAPVDRTARGGPTPRRPGLKSSVPAASARQPWPAVRRLWAVPATRSADSGVNRGKSWGRRSWALAPAPTISISIADILELSIPIPIPDTLGTLRRFADHKPLCLQHIFCRGHLSPIAAIRHLGRERVVLALV